MAGLVAIGIAGCDSPDFEERVLEFERGTGLAFQDCGTEGDEGSTPCNLVASDEVECFLGAWERCTPAKLLVYQYEGSNLGWVKGYYYVIPLENGGCEVVVFERANACWHQRCSVWEMTKHCAGVEYSTYCLEGTSCTY
jgi:hypothetical protein